MDRLQTLIKRHRWHDSWMELLHVLRVGTLDVQKYNTWGKYAGEIETGLKHRWTDRERFWRDMNTAVVAAEKQRKVRTHKGLIYFKIGAMVLFNDGKYHTVIQWLERAYKEDERLWQQNYQRLPQHESAYRLLHIIRALDHFSKESVFAKQAINIKGKQIGLFFGQVYDYSLTRTQRVTTLSIKAFDKLLGRNPYRVRVEQNYRAAEWVLLHKAELEKTNTEKYGVAEAVVVLCATTIEGILLSKPAVRLKVPKNQRKRLTLGGLSVSFISHCRPSPILTVGLVFVWYARNLIHPGRWKRLKKVTVDMNFADFTLSLTGSVIARMVKRSRRRKI